MLVARLDSERVDAGRFISFLQLKQASATYREIWRDLISVPTHFPPSALSFVEISDI